MKSFEAMNFPPAPKEEKPGFIVGAKRKPDGSMDNSRAAEMADERSEAVGTEAEKFQPDVKEILKHLAALETLLDPEKLLPRANWDTELNNHFTAASVFKQVLSEISPEEYEAIEEKVQIIRKNLAAALAHCQDEAKKRAQDGGGEYVSEATLYWLEKEGPAVLSSLDKLKHNRYLT